MWGFIILFSILGMIIFLLLSVRSVSKNQSPLKNLAGALGLFTIFLVVALNFAPKPSVTPINIASINQDTSPKIEDVAVKAESNDIEIARFNEFISNIRGAQFIKHADLKESKAIIEYVKDFAEYKAIHSESQLVESDYVQYWSSGDQINKTLMGESVRVLRDFPTVKSVNITIPFEGKRYMLDLDRETTEEYFNINL